MAGENLGYGTGRRKASVARVYLRAGSGAIMVNGKDVKDYFCRDSLTANILQPLELTETAGKFDVCANLTGGGLRGQAEALRLGISRALIEVDPELRGSLKKAGFLTRDAREVERKKYGLRGARRRFQFSKR